MLEELLGCVTSKPTGQQVLRAGATKPTKGTRAGVRPPKLFSCFSSKHQRVPNTFWPGLFASSWLARNGAQGIPQGHLLPQVSPTEQQKEKNSPFSPTRAIMQHHFALANSCVALCFCISPRALAIAEQTHAALGDTTLSRRAMSLPVCLPAV